MRARVNGIWRYGAPPAQQRGAVLVTVLAVLMALMIASVAAARLAIDDERSAQHELDRHLAFQAAEAALDDSLFNLGQVVLAPSSASEAPAWQSFDLADTQSSNSYGQFSPRLMAYGEGNLPAHPPGFVVERLALPGWPAQAETYRITSIGFGRQASTFVVLQSIVQVTEGNKKTRLSWREIGNWRELHNAVP